MPTPQTRSDPCPSPTSGSSRAGALRRFLAGAGGQAGSAMAEFALIVPALLAIVGGILEFSGIAFVQTLLEGGIREASRFGIIGSAPNGTTREAAILAIIDKNSFGIIDSGQVHLDTLAYGSFSAVGQPESFDDANGNGSYDPGETYDDVNGNGQWDDDQGVAGSGGASEVVLYRLTYDWDIMIPIFRPFFGDQITLEASIAVRNEPFDS